MGMGLSDSGTVSDSVSYENGALPESVSVPDGGAVLYNETVLLAVGLLDSRTVPDSGTLTNRNCT